MYPTIAPATTNKVTSTATMRLEFIPLILESFMENEMIGPMRSSYID